MADDNQNSAQEKTEQPTPRRIEKAVEDGKVVTSKEMAVFTSIFMLCMLFLLVPPYFNEMLAKWGSMFEDIGGIAHGVSPLEPLKETFRNLFIIVIVIGVPLVFATFLTQHFVGGLIFSLKSIEFKFSKLDPIKGLGRIFSIKGLVELGKSVTKVICLFGIGIFVFYHITPEIIQITKLSLERSVILSAKYFPILLVSMLLGLIVIAIIDLVWQKHSYIKNLRMNRQDMKDESKETEGSPEVRAKIRKLQHETSQRAMQQNEAVENVKDATAVIVNPTHFAVAVKYNIGDDAAPMVLAMGRGIIAEKIITKAKECGITVFSSPLLARALYFTSEIGKEISEKLYTAVAVALAYIYKIDKGENIEEPSIDIPDDLIYDENGLQQEK